jgi:hypothetical protein
MGAQCDKRKKQWVGIVGILKARKEERMSVEEHSPGGAT